MTKFSSGRTSLPNNHPQVVAMIQKNHRAQSKERIFEITSEAVLRTTLLLSFYRAGEQTAYEVALQGEELNQWDEHAEESAGSKQIPILTTITDDGRQLHGHDADIRIGSQDDQRHKVVIPNPEELKD